MIQLYDKYYVNYSKITFKSFGMPGVVSICPLLFFQIIAGVE